MDPVLFLFLQEALCWVTGNKYQLKHFLDTKKLVLGMFFFFFLNDYCCFCVTNGTKSLFIHWNKVLYHDLITDYERFVLQNK